LTKLVVDFCDKCLRRYNSQTRKTFSEVSEDVSLDVVFDLVVHTCSMGEFIKEYTKRLVSRLLSWRMAVRKIEAPLLNRLINMGSEKISNSFVITEAQCLWNNIKEQLATSQGFNKFLQSSLISPGNLKTEIFLLNEYKWVDILATVTTMNSMKSCCKDGATAYPKEVHFLMGMYEKFFQERVHAKNATVVPKIIGWVDRFSLVELRLDYLDKEYSVTLSMEFAVVLMLFNRENHLNEDQIVKLSGLTTEKANNAVKILCHEGLLTRRRQQASKQSEPEAALTVSLNTDFRDTASRIRIVGKGRSV